MFDHFAKEKSDFLRKKDKSKKGYIDKNIIRIVNLINSKRDFYTTSSCAGRIVLLETKSKKKNECGWIFSKHGKVTLNEINNALNEYNKNKKIRERPLKVSKIEETRFKYSIWFKQQPIILHIACRNPDAAKRLLDIARKIFRRAGIIGITERKTTIEIIGDERLETIIADKDFVADEGYMRNLVKYANNNFAENKRKSGEFFRLIINL